MTETTFTPEENLAFIRGVMEKARHTTTKAGSFLAVWGSLSAFVTLFQYLAVNGSFPITYMPYLWGMFLIAGVSFTVIKGKQLSREKDAACENDVFTSMLFTSIGISIGVFFFANIIGAMTGQITHIGVEICYVISLLMATAFYAASFSTGITWFRLVAFGWWAAVLLFVLKPFGDEYLLLTIAILDFLLIAVPGFKLMSLAKHDDQNAVM